jgi:RHS repeat-associated protein
VPQRRTGWLDRELDYETAPGHVRHKLYDLDHRKYDAATAQFLSVDPLWPMFISSGSYVYCTGDAINNVDPWGLGEEGTSPLIPPPSKPKVPCSPMVIGHGDETIGGSLWTYEILFGQYLRKLGATGDGMGPQGNGPGVSVLTPPGGIGPGGKGGVGYWSGRGATPETAVQLKGVTVSADRYEVNNIFAAQLAFNEIAVPIMLAEPTPFGELFVGAVNLAFVAYQLQLRYEESLGAVSYEKGDPIDIERFSVKGKRGKLIDPKTKQWLEPERGSNPHGGSHWKLFAKDGKRIGTISKDGRWLRP